MTQGSAANSPWSRRPLELLWSTSGPQHTHPSPRREPTASQDLGASRASLDSKVTRVREASPGPRAPWPWLCRPCSTVLLQGGQGAEMELQGSRVAAAASCSRFLSTSCPQSLPVSESFPMSQLLA